MKIALFCPTVSGRGGVEAAVRSLMAGFDTLGDECRLFLLGGSVDKGWLDGLSYTAIGTPEDAKLLRLTKYAMQPTMELLNWKPDAVIAADMTTLRMAIFARRFSGRRKMPVASWIHYPVAKLRMKEYLQEADCHLAISRGVADEICAALPAQADRTFTIFNGLDVDAAPLLPRAESPTFLYVGRLTYDDQKRVNDFLHALSRLRGEFRAKIIGAAPKARAEDGMRLRSLADELELGDRVEWLGWQDDPWQAAGSASALVLTSAFEGFGMILLEAISRGLPCISSDCESGPTDIIEPGKNGWLYPVANVDRLAALMQQVLDRPEILPDPHAVKETARKFSASSVAERARQALLSVMKK
jgi:UDP-D-galactose:(glucosyl)LPS alpha-1,6-D-galactosyltransferase